MIDFITFLFFGVCWIWGIHCLFLPQYILGKIGEWLEKKLPEWVVDPLFVCPSCMSSVHGTMVYLALSHNPTIMGPFGWISFCICLCGINYYLVQVTNK